MDCIDSLRPLIGKIMATGIKSADATHLACAIYANCNYFVTTDDRILKYRDNKIKIINPIDMIQMMEA